MNKLIKAIFCIMIIGFQAIPVSLASTGNFSAALEDSISTISEHLDTPQDQDLSGSGTTLVNFLFKLLDNFIIPIAIAVGIVVGVVGAYKLLFSNDEKQISTGLKMVIFGIIGIIVMISAKYIGSVLFIDIFDSGNTNGITGIQLSQSLYNKIIYPFIKIALYLALAVIFIILVGKSISLITKSDGTSHKKALGMIGRCAVSILVIIGAKNIVEAIYGKQDDVFNNAANLGDIGSGILADKNIPIIYNIISWAVGIISLIIFILLLVQGFKILTNPSKSENFQKLGKALLYTVIGLFVIGIGYLIANAFILN